MAKTVAEKWKELKPDELGPFQNMAEKDLERYRVQMEEYQTKLARRCRMEREQVEADKAAADQEVAAVFQSPESTSMPQSSHPSSNGIFTLNLQSQQQQQQQQQQQPWVRDLLFPHQQTSTTSSAPSMAQLPFDQLLQQQLQLQQWQQQRRSPPPPPLQQHQQQQGEIDNDSAWAQLAAFFGLPLSQTMQNDQQQQQQQQQQQSQSSALFIPLTQQQQQQLQQLQLQISQEQQVPQPQPQITQEQQIPQPQLRQQLQANTGTLSLSTQQQQAASDTLQDLSYLMQVFLQQQQQQNNSCATVLSLPTEPAPAPSSHQLHLQQQQCQPEQQDQFQSQSSVQLLVNAAQQSGVTLEQLAILLGVQPKIDQGDQQHQPWQQGGSGGRGDAGGSGGYGGQLDGSYGTRHQGSAW